MYAAQTHIFVNGKIQFFQARKIYRRRINDRTAIGRGFDAAHLHVFRYFDELPGILKSYGFLPFQ